MRKVACKAALMLLSSALASCGGGGGGGGSGLPVGQSLSSQATGESAGAQTLTAQLEAQAITDVSRFSSVQADASGLAGGMNDTAAMSARAELELATTVTFDSEIKIFTMLGPSYLGGRIGQTIVRLDREPYGPIYPVIVGSQEPLDILWLATGAVRYPDGRYEAFLSQKRHMPAGTYTGTVQFKLCKDPLCAAEYRVLGGSLPYLVEYLPEEVLTMKLDGVTTSVRYGGPNRFVVADGVTVEIESSIPVNWEVNSFNVTRTLDIAEMTDRRIVGTMTPEGWTAGYVQVVGRPLDARHTMYPDALLYGTRTP